MSSSTSSTCCTIDPNSLSSSDKSSWCSANRATCDTLCNSNASENSCDTSTLDYSCKCNSGSDPDLSDYANTIPSLMCTQWQSDCVASVPNDLTAQQQCHATACGSKTAGADSSVASSASSTAGQTRATLSSSSPTTSQTSTDSSSTQSDTSSRRSGTTSATQTSGTTSSAPTGSSTGSFDGSNQNNNSTDTGNTPHGDGGLGTGAKAGIAVGVVLGVLIIALILFLLRRRSRKTKALATAEPREPYKPSDEKQVAIPVASDISQKPELHSEPRATDPGMPYPSPGQWQPHLQNGAELYNSNGYPAELHGTAYATPVELHSSPRSESLEPQTWATTQTAQPLGENSQPEPEAVPSQSQSSEPALGTRRQLSTEDVAALEEEERRIDAEMAEVERLKELREQKFAIQQKLRDAKGQ